MSLSTLLLQNASLRASTVEARRDLALAYGLPTEDAMPNAAQDEIQATARQWLALCGGAWWNRTLVRQIERRLTRLFCGELVPGQQVLLVLRAWNRDTLCVRHARVVEQDGDRVTVALRGVDGTVYRRVQRSQVRTCRA